MGAVGFAALAANAHLVRPPLGPPRRRCEHALQGAWIDPGRCQQNGQVAEPLGMDLHAQ